MKKFDDNYVRMATKKCPVCGKEHTPSQGGEILMHKQGRAIKDEQLCTGMGYCDEHQAIVDEGKIFLIEAKDTSGGTTGLVKHENMNRTGRMVIITKEAFEGIFKQSAPKGGLTYIKLGVLEALEAIKNGNNPTVH